MNSRLLLSTRVWMMDARSSPLSRKLPSDKRLTWPTSPTDSPSTTSTVRHTQTHTVSGSLTSKHISSLAPFAGLVSHADVSVAAEALNQGENVDLDALMADLCSIEQELSTINTKPNSAGSLARLGLTDTKVNTVPVLDFLFKKKKQQQQQQQKLKKTLIKFMGPHKILQL